MPLPWHPMFLEELKAGRLVPYQGPGAPAGAGGPAPLQPGNQYGPTPFGVMGQYPPPDPAMQVPVDPQMLPTEDPMAGMQLPPNPTGLSGMDAHYGAPPASPDYAAYDAHTEEMARQMRKQAIYQTLLAAGTGMLSQPGNLQAGMAAASQNVMGVLGPNPPKLAEMEMREERRKDREGMESQFLQNRKAHYGGIQEQLKAEVMHDYTRGEGGGLYGGLPGMGTGVPGMGMGAGAGATAKQRHDYAAFQMLLPMIPPEHHENAMGNFLSGGLEGVREYMVQNGMFGMDPYDPQEGLQQIGSTGVFIDKIGMGYMIPSLEGPKWVRAEDVTIPDPSLLAYDQAMMEQAKLEISLANTLRRMQGGMSTEEDITKLTAGLSEGAAAMLASFMSTGRQITPEEMQTLITDWLTNAGYQSNMQRYGGLIFRPGALAYNTQMELRTARGIGGGRVPAQVTPGQPVAPISGADMGHQVIGGETFNPGEAEKFDFMVESNGGPEAFYNAYSQALAEGRTKGRYTQKEFDRIMGERYGVGPQAKLFTGGSDTTGQTGYQRPMSAGVHPPGSPAGLPGSMVDQPAPGVHEGGVLSRGDQLQAASDEIAEEKFGGETVYARGQRGWTPGEGSGNIPKPVWDKPQDPGARLEEAFKQAASGITLFDRRRWKQKFDQAPTFEEKQAIIEQMRKEKWQ